MTVPSVTSKDPSSLHYWRPWSLSPWVLLSFLLINIGLVALLEALSGVSRHRGAIAFVNPDRGFGSGMVFAYLYLPTVIAILLSNAWSWVDLDVKRLEPYFQMSKHEGATVQDSIHLHYPFEFIAFAPLRALKRRSGIIRNSTRSC